MSDAPEAPRLMLRRPPLVVRIIPYFFPAFLFSSVFFAAFCPLPFLIRRERAGKGWFYLSFATNALLVGVLARGGTSGGDLVSGVLYAGVFLAYALPVGMLLPALVLRFKWKIESAVGAAIACTALAVTLLAFGAKPLLGVDAIGGAKRLLAEQIEAYSKLSPEKAIQVFGTDSPEAFREKIWREIPASALLVLLLTTWGNALLWLRINPERVRERLGLGPRFLSEWRAPEFLVWPAIAIGALAVLGPPESSALAWSFLRLIGAIYVLQGLSILSFFLDLGRVYGLFRPLLFLLALLFLVPLLLAAGFLDLWFDFRSRFRQA